MNNNDYDYDNTETDEVEPVAAEIWPIDPDLVVKGRTIPRDHLRISAEPGTDEYRFAAMRRVDEITGWMRANHRPCTIVHRGIDLYVLTDAEAVEYHRKRSDKALESMGRHASNLRLVVDRSALTDEMREAHDRHMAVTAIRYQAARGAAKTLARREPGANTGIIPRTLGRTE